MRLESSKALALAKKTMPGVLHGRCHAHPYGLQPCSERMGTKGLYYGNNISGRDLHSLLLHLRYIQLGNLVRRMPAEQFVAGRVFASDRWTIFWTRRAARRSPSIARTHGAAQRRRPDRRLPSAARGPSRTQLQRPPFLTGCAGCVAHTRWAQLVAGERHRGPHHTHGTRTAQRPHGGSPRDPVCPLPTTAWRRTAAHGICTLTLQPPHCPTRRFNH